MRYLGAKLLDAGMCGMMYALQRRHRLAPESLSRFDAYFAGHENQTRDAFFHAPPLLLEETSALRWKSPVDSPFAENNECHVNLFPCEEEWSRPTVIMLHALMSASDRGYREWARRFNEQNWNAVFVHLPYHYSRTPRRHWNGELAITADVVRTVEALRAGVSEIRQLMAWLRRKGSPSFGLWACSYGGWIGSLLASVEADFEWIALIEPILNIEHAIWVSPAGRAVRAELRRAGITQEQVSRHFLLASPMHGRPSCAKERMIFAAGEYDTIARLEDIRAAQAQWGGELITARQGHFGFQLMQGVWSHLCERGLLDTAAISRH